MHNPSELLQNEVLICSLVSWFIAQVLKIPTYLLVEKELNWRRFFGSGGMPSSHTSFVVALTLMTGFDAGFQSVAFAIAFTLAAIVMYDAMGVRREAGEHARLLNKYLNQLETQNADIDGDGIPDKEYDEIELKEFIGHTPLQVLGGVLLGILVGVLIPA